METLLIVGCGDVARRALPRLQRRYRLCALVRAHDPALEASGIELVLGDLDRPETLHRLPAAGRVAHLAPPSETGLQDMRTRTLLDALEGAAKRGGMLPQRVVYISTSGVYGDCGGALVDEARQPRPRSDRARRRLDAETALGAWAARRGAALVVLRAPGIYAAGRLPRERLERRLPALRAEEDVYTNHVHADDLATIVALALEAGASGTYNASDDTHIRAGDWLDLVADHAGLARPPRISRREAESLLSPVQMSFLRESRRLVNARMKRELGVRLAYPTVHEGLAASRAAALSS